MVWDSNREFPYHGSFLIRGLRDNDDQKPLSKALFPGGLALGG